MRISRALALSCGLLLTLASCRSSKAVNTATPAAPSAAASTAAPATAAAAAATTVATSAALSAATTQPAAAPAAPAAALPAIYNFKTTKVGGGAVDGAEFAGKPVAFWFWAPT